MPSNAYNPDQDIGDLTGKVILITGGTAGLGAGSVMALAKHDPAKIIFTGRNEEKANALIAQFKTSLTSSNTELQFYRCDISSFASVRNFVAKILATIDRLDIVMLNAGIMATPPSASPDGYQNEFATNHLGHALLLDLLLPLLRSTASTSEADVRVINLASYAYKYAPSQGIDFATLKTPQKDLGGFLAGIIPGHRWSRYGQTKLAQVLYSRELAKHYPEITFVAVHPGFIITDLYSGLPFLTTLPVLLISLGRRTKVEEGHYNQCWAATCDKRLLKNGGYYEPVGVLTRPSTRQGNDPHLAQELWDWTQKQF